MDRGSRGPRYWVRVTTEDYVLKYLHMQLLYLLLLLLLQSASVAAPTSASISMAAALSAALWAAAAAGIIRFPYYCCFCCCIHCSVGGCSKAVVAATVTPAVMGLLFLLPLLPLLPFLLRHPVYYCYGRPWLRPGSASILFGPEIQVPL